VFVRSGTSWSQQQKLTASDAAAGDVFGLSVGISGDTVVAGARSNDDGGTDSGSAYVFTRNGTSWSEQQKLTASDAAAGDFFGASVCQSAAIRSWPARFLTTMTEPVQARPCLRATQSTARLQWSNP
jgi:hypothetical protein